MDKNYYTPGICEFYVGFEYEYKYTVTDTEWYKACVNKGDPLIFSKGSEYRVKYLDLEDFKDVGFTVTNTNLSGRMSTTMYINDRFIVFHQDYLSKGKSFNLYIQDLGFHVRNKSELVSLLRMLSII